MTTAKRFGKRWNINECIQLQREFELLELSIDDIAENHQRTPGAIMSRLAYEGFADYNVLYSNYYNLNSTIPAFLDKGNDNAEDDDNTEDDDAEQDNDAEEDDDNSSDYQEEEEEDEEGEDEEEEEEEDEEDDKNRDNEYDVDDLKHHVFRLEKKLNELTQLILNESKSKTKTRSSLFSMFA